MFGEDDPPRPATPGLGRPLDRLGIAELTGYIDELRAEIARVEAEVTRKRGFAAAAASVFRT